MLTGLVLAGFPAVAMAYVAEEFHPSGLGTAMGLYISGTGLGGMTGRLAGGLITGVASWRVAMVCAAVVCLVGTVWVALQLPASRNFEVTPGRLGERLTAMRAPLRDPVILKLAATGFVLMGSLVSYYNYLQYRLGDTPFSLPDTVIPFVFLIYLSGTLSANWMGRLTDRRSRRGVMMLGLAIMAVGALMSLSTSCPSCWSAPRRWCSASSARTRSPAASSASGPGNNARRPRPCTSSAITWVRRWRVSSEACSSVPSAGSGEVGTVMVLLAVGAVAICRLPARSDRTEVANAS